MNFGETSQHPFSYLERMSEDRIIKRQYGSSVNFHILKNAECPGTQTIPPSAYLCIIPIIPLHYKRISRAFFSHSMNHTCVCIDQRCTGFFIPTKHPRCKERSNVSSPHTAQPTPLSVFGPRKIVGIGKDPTN